MSLQIKKIIEKKGQGNSGPAGPDLQDMVTGKSREESLIFKSDNLLRFN